ncbi:MAG: hypothetical protein JW768_12875 [Chitinispirillaceae bacterium]|nr:hypothetical protein [Chitinispirillaceae bacterium]
MKDILKFLSPRRLIINLFHLIYYHNKNTWSKNQFLGYPILQCPFDMQTYQELIFNIRPTSIIQTGISYGGSLLYFASLLDLMNAPPGHKVIGIDIELTEKAKTLNHPRIIMIEGDSVALSSIQKVESLMDPKGPVMVILDSDHSKDHVLKELELYSGFVTAGSYLIVEDTNINGHPVAPFFGPGPLEAVKVFLKNNSSFLHDKALSSRHFFSYHQGGWLKKIN